MYLGLVDDVIYDMLVIESIYLFDWNFYAAQKMKNIVALCVYTHQICNLEVEHWSNIWYKKFCLRYRVFHVFIAKYGKVIYNLKLYDIRFYSCGNQKAVGQSQSLDFEA